MKEEGCIFQFSKLVNSDFSSSSALGDSGPVTPMILKIVRFRGRFFDVNIYAYLY